MTTPQHGDNVVAFALRQLGISEKTPASLLALNYLKSGDSVLLTSPSFTGKTRVAIAAAIQEIFLKYRNVIVVAPSRLSCENLMKRYRALLAEHEWFYHIHIRDLGVPDTEAHKYGTYIPYEIVIGTPEEIHLELLRNGNKRWKNFLQNTGQIQILNSHLYDGIPHLHASLTIRRLILMIRNIKINYDRKHRVEITDMQDLCVLHTLHSTKNSFEINNRFVGALIHKAKFREISFLDTTPKDKIVVGARLAEKNPRQLQLLPFTVAAMALQENLRNIILIGFDNYLISKDRRYIADQFQIEGIDRKIVEENILLERDLRKEGLSDKLRSCPLIILGGAPHLIFESYRYLSELGIFFKDRNPYLLGICTDEVSEFFYAAIMNHFYRYENPGIRQMIPMFVDEYPVPDQEIIDRVIAPHTICAFLDNTDHQTGFNLLSLSDLQYLLPIDTSRIQALLEFLHQAEYIEKTSDGSWKIVAIQSDYYREINFSGIPSEERYELRDAETNRLILITDEFQSKTRFLPHTIHIINDTRYTVKEPQFQNQRIIYLKETQEIVFTELDYELHLSEDIHSIKGENSITGSGLKISTIYPQEKTTVRIFLKNLRFINVMSRKIQRIAPLGYEESNSLHCLVVTFTRENLSRQFSQISEEVIYSLKELMVKAMAFLTERPEEYCFIRPEIFSENNMLSLRLSFAMRRQYKSNFLELVKNELNFRDQSGESMILNTMVAWAQTVKVYYDSKTSEQSENSAEEKEKDTHAENEPENTEQNLTQTSQESPEITAADYTLAQVLLFLFEPDCPVDIQQIRSEDYYPEPLVKRLPAPATQSA